MYSAAPEASSDERKEVSGGAGAESSRWETADAVTGEREAQPKTVKADAESASASRASATRDFEASLLKIHILRIVVPHVGFLEFRIVEIHLLVLLVAVFIDVLALVLERLQIIEIVVLGPPSETPFRFAPALHGFASSPLGDAFFGQIYMG
jgi:hypothetical protein